MTTIPHEAAELSHRATIQEIVKVYETEIQSVRKAYETLGQASVKLTQAFGKETTYSDICTLPERHYDAERVAREVELNIRARCWANLLDRLGIRKLLSVKRNEELSKRLSEKDKLPEITVAEVFSMFTTLTANANEFAVEAIREVYQFLLTEPETYRWKYKTNQHHTFEHIGKKVILPGYVRTAYGGGFQVNYYRTDHLRALDKVFHALDAQPFNDAGYQSPLIDAINTQKESTAYFKFKCYQNGNLHLEFTRADLLKLFNQYANNGTALKSGQIF